MHAFEVVRIVAGVLTLLLNAGFGIFLMLDYLRLGKDVLPESYHAPAILAEFGTMALAVLFISLTFAVELFRRDNPPGITQVRFEVAWIGVVIFLQYSSAIVQTILYWFAFDCSVAVQLSTCRMHNMVTFIASLAIPFTTLVYFIFLIVIASRATKRDLHRSVWKTPFREVDWAGRQRASTLIFDRMSIASFSNKEEAIMTLKSQPTLRGNTFRITTPATVANDQNLEKGYLPQTIAPPPPVATQPPPPGLAAPRGRQSFSPKPLQMLQTIRESLSGPPGGRGSLSVRSEASVYSTDSPVIRPGQPIVPKIVRTSASTLRQSLQSPIMALSKVKYFAATR